MNKLAYKNGKLKIYTGNDCNTVKDIRKELESKIICTDSAYFNEIKYFVDCLENNMNTLFCSLEDTLESFKMLIEELKSVKVNSSTCSDSVS